jgi:hypothetical protein
VSELRSTQGILNRQIQNLGTELIGFRTDMQRYSNEIKELAAVLTKAKDAG